MKITTTSFIAALWGATLCLAQNNVVYYGANSNTLDVVFVDTTLSVTNQSAIIADLNVCLLEWGKKSELRFYGKEINGETGYFYNPSLGFIFRFFPENIVSTPGGHALRISQELSDAYTNAFAFAAAHSNEMAAAYEFVAFVSSANFSSIPASDLPNYVLPKFLSDAEIIADAPKIMTQLGWATYYPPSILSFLYFDIGPGPATSNLFFSIPSYDDGWHGTSAIWHDGKWKFCNRAWFPKPPPYEE